MGISESCEHDMEIEVMPRYDTDELGVPISIYNAASRNVCKTCGFVTHSFPYPERLKAAVAVFRCKLPEKLLGQEIRFLRKALGWTAATLADQLAVAAETVSRWENDKLPMAPTAEKLLRIHVYSALKEKAPAIDVSVSELAGMTIKAIRANADIPRLGLEIVRVREKGATSDEYAEPQSRAA